jgi:hypothetical protein
MIGKRMMMLWPAVVAGLLTVLATVAFVYYLWHRLRGPSETPSAGGSTVSYDRVVDLTVTEAQLDAKAEVPVHLPEGRTITVRLGRPMADGCRLRLRGLGSEGKGDLYIRVHVRDQG